MPGRTGLLAAGLWLLAATAAAQDAPNGVLLVASRDLADPNFRETVVLATRHPGGGPVGVVLNRPTPVLLRRLFPEHEALRGRPDRLFAGGPVSPRALVAVFRSKERPGEALWTRRPSGASCSGAPRPARCGPGQPSAPVSPAGARRQQGRTGR